MFLLYGLRTVRKNVSTGLFSCPRCQCDRNFTRQALRRFITIFFIPIIPLKRMGEIIHCMSCNGDFTLETLDRPTVSNLAVGMAAATRVTVAAMVASAQSPSDQMKNRAIETAVRAGTNPYDAAHLDADVAWVTDDLVQSYVEPFASGLTMTASEQFLGQVATVGAVDGPLNGRQRAILDRLSVLFGLTATHLMGVLANVGASEFLMGQSPVGDPAPVPGSVPAPTPPVAPASSSGDFA